MASKLEPITRIHLNKLWTSYGHEPELPHWMKEGLGLGEKISDPSDMKRRKAVTETVKVILSV